MYKSQVLLEIRKAQPEDAVRISSLIQSVSAHNPNNYSEVQLTAWNKYVEADRIRIQIQERTIFCAFEKEELRGTIGIKGEYIFGFYVGKRFMNQGIGTKLLHHVEAYARNKQLTRLILTSTPSAVTYYLNRGFVSKGNVTLKIYDVEFLETKMEKRL